MTCWAEPTRPSVAQTSLRSPFAALQPKVGRVIRLNHKADAIPPQLVGRVSPVRREAGGGGRRVRVAAGQAAGGVAARRTG